jgi:hypothetical protein
MIRDADMAEQDEDAAQEQESSLSDEERQTLREQYIEVYDKSQESFDTSVRTLAAAGIAVTVTLGAAFKTLSGAGTIAVICFVVSLLATLVSFQTVQWDMKSRISALEEQRDEGSFTSGWNKVTTGFNWAAGILFFAGAIALCRFVYVHA